MKNLRISKRLQSIVMRKHRPLACIAAFSLVLGDQHSLEFALSFGGISVASAAGIQCSFETLRKFP